MLNSQNKKYEPIENKLLFDDLLFDQSDCLDQNTDAHCIKNTSDRCLRKSCF